MPKQFVACEDGAVMVKCCLNAAGDGQKCGPCPRCTYMRGTRRCGNTSCADSRLCHIHYGMLYGVKLFDTAYGKGLMATRDFARGALICPVGGRRVKDVHAWWANSTDSTAPYAYTLDDAFGSYSLWVRNNPSVQGYVPAAQATTSEPQWREVTTEAGRKALTGMRRAYRKGKTVYLIDPADWETFVRDAARRARRRAQARVQEINLEAGGYDVSRVMHPSQFAAKMVARVMEGPQIYDASCLRAVGSYSNDGIDVSGRTRGRTNNCTITPVSPFPLAQSGWLVATKAIRAGEEILNDYGLEYWTTTQLQYGHKEVKKAAGFGGTVGVEPASKGLPWRPAERTPCPKL